MWQKLREELYPQGLEVVTVALDIGGISAALPCIEAAKPTHPSLIDEAHLLDELFGIVNVPSGVWIDEQGVIVRAPELANTPDYPTTMRITGKVATEWIDTETGKFPDVREKGYDANKLIADSIRDKIIAELKSSSVNEINDKKSPAGEKYFAAIRDWAKKGRDSRYILTPEEVLRRSRPRPLEEALGAAHFELGHHLYRDGNINLAVIHFKEAHRLQPNNWTYLRQALSLLDPFQGPTDTYESDYWTEVQKPRSEEYYAPLEMD